MGRVSCRKARDGAGSTLRVGDDQSWLQWWCCPVVLSCGAVLCCVLAALTLARMALLGALHLVVDQTLQGVLLGVLVDGSLFVMERYQIALATETLPMGVGALSSSAVQGRGTVTFAWPTLANLLCLCPALLTHCGSQQSSTSIELN